MAPKLSALAKSALSLPLSGGVWKPIKEGDVLEGIVETIGESQGKFGPQMTLTLKCPDGYKMVYANESMKRGIVDNKVKEGMRVAIAYRGDVKTGKGRPFRLFSVATAKV